MISYAKLINESKQMSRLSKDIFIDLAVLISTSLFLDDKILINLLKLRQVRDKNLVELNIMHNKFEFHLCTIK